MVRSRLKIACPRFYDPRCGAQYLKVSYPIVLDLRIDNSRTDFVVYSFVSIMENTRPQIVHCVRHAQGIHNLTIENHGLLDPVLTVFGEQQCHELARDFTGHNNVELVVASPLKRTVYTALSAFAPVLSRGRAVVCLPEIQETTDLPCDTGSDLETIQQVFKGLPVDLSLVVEGWQVKVRHSSRLHLSVAIP